MTTQQALIFGSVRRDDLVQSDASCCQPQSPNASLQAQYLERLGAQYNLPATGPTREAEEPTVEDPVGQKEAGDPTDGYEFRLFLKSARPRAAGDPDDAIQRITLRSPTPGNDEPGFIISRRPDKYYFTGSVNSEQADQYRQAAVSYEDLITGSRTRWVRFAARQSLCQTDKYSEGVSSHGALPSSSHPSPPRS